VTARRSNRAPTEQPGCGPWLKKLQDQLHHEPVGRRDGTDRFDVFPEDADPDASGEPISDSATAVTAPDDRGTGRMRRIGRVRNGS
jgi:hypothetical protein